MNTKKNYVAIAKSIKEDRTLHVADKVKMAMILADYFITDNNKFSRDTFYTACGFNA
jgi:hypothetical protein